MSPVLPQAQGQWFYVLSLSLPRSCLLTGNSWPWGTHWDGDTLVGLCIDCPALLRALSRCAARAAEWIGCFWMEGRAAEAAGRVFIEPALDSRLAHSPGIFLRFNVSKDRLVWHLV